MACIIVVSSKRTRALFPPFLSHSAPPPTEHSHDVPPPLSQPPASQPSQPSQPSLPELPPPLFSRRNNTPYERSAPLRQFSLSRQPPSPAPDMLPQIEQYYDKYRDSDEDAILAEGMERFCTDLGVDPTEFIVLVVAWKFGASQMCRFTREEFINGCKKLQVHDAESLKKILPGLRIQCTTPATFKELYNFSFSFGLDHSVSQRSLPVDMAIPLWDLVFTLYKPFILESWFDFLRENDVRGISRDTWNLFLPFARTVTPSFSNYDESEAWPSLFDDFVEHELSKKRSAGSTY